MSRRRTTCALFALAALSLALRLLGAEEVFRGESIVFRGFDAYYHARRALYSLVHFPAVLDRDPYLNFPYGSAVPWPPLYDLLVAGLARLGGGDAPTLERIAALLPPLAGALLVLPVFAVARGLAGVGAGLAAAFYVAVLNAAVNYARVGFADHHAAVALLGATLLAVTSALVERGGERSARALWLALVGLRVSLALTWGGSVLLFAFAEAALLVAGVATPDPVRRSRLRLAQAGSALVTAALLLPLAQSVATTADYGASPILFTTFQPMLFAMLALLALALEGFERMRRDPPAWQRIGTALATASALAVAALLGMPGLERGLDEGLRFMASSHIREGLVLEEMPLFAARGSFDRTLPERLFGWAVYALPAVPLAAVPGLRDPARRARTLLFVAWFLGFAALAWTGLRWTNDFAYAAAVGLALASVEAGRRLARSRRLPRAGQRLALAALVAILLVPVLRVHLERARGSWRALRGEAPPSRLEEVAHRFSQELRLATPETSGYLDAGRAPEYGVFTWSGIGHALHYVARRPTPADNFGRMIGLDDRNFRLSTELYLLRGERPAVRVLEALHTPYLVVPGIEAPVPDLLMVRLHRDDGAARPGRPAYERFRLLLESTPLGPRGGYLKLFELVPGALLQVEAAPGAQVEVRVALVTNAGRRLVWATRASAGPDGRARLRVPYATRDASAPTQASGPAQVLDASAPRSVPIPERAVREGLSVPVPLAAPP